MTRIAPWARLAMCLAAALLDCGAHAADTGTDRVVARVSPGTVPAADLFVAGQRALGILDYTSAYRWLRDAAEQGYAPAQCALGGMYLAGLGVAADDAQALGWYRKAAEQGNAEAQTSLGLMYAHGRGVAMSDAAAVKWFRLAAEQGGATGQSNLGVMYLEGRGVDRSDTAAEHWFHKAGVQGEPLAQYNLGLLFRDARGVEQDLVEAAWWLTKAAEQEHAEAQADLGLMYAEGRGVPNDASAAVQWWRRSAEQGPILSGCQPGHRQWGRSGPGAGPQVADEFGPAGPGPGAGLSVGQRQHKCGVRETIARRADIDSAELAHFIWQKKTTFHVLFQINFPGRS